MKPIPRPQIEGKTDSERFNNALRRVFSAPNSKNAHKEIHPNQRAPKNTMDRPNSGRPIE